VRNLLSLLILSIPFFLQSQEIPGLKDRVEIFRDANGVNHIYAQNEHDLFFAQGYCAARDRLFQFEIWRRQATGTVAEVLGESEVNRDIGARLFRFRGDLKKELQHYHSNGESIIRAFTDGVNQWITETERKPELLPLEFRLLGIQPGRWTPEVVISRHQGLLNNLSREVTFGRAVANLGADMVKELNTFEPGEPDLSIDPLITKELLAKDLIAPYNAFRQPLVFQPSHLRTSGLQNKSEDFQTASSDFIRAWQELMENDVKSIGSNNWVVSGKRSASGFPLLANDPHRVLAVPSLRYIVHLNAPPGNGSAGWNVVGGGEPVIPGISIGHNEYGAWGLTIFEIDAEDLMVYETDPLQPTRYKYKGNWEEMRAETDTIFIKGGKFRLVKHLFTRHGPVTFVDSIMNRACAVRAAWLDYGNAPYLASLRMNQSRNWQEFRSGCEASFLPGENMIWADRKGNIGWQAVGLAPIRKNWSGLVPVPGDGRFEWNGYLPIKNLPHEYNPSKGFVATANENNVPSGFAYRDAVGWTWAENFRSRRIHEVLKKLDRAKLDDMMRLQIDYLSIPAREMVPLLNTQLKDELTEKARQELLKWDFRMEIHSVAAGIYAAWEKELQAGVRQLIAGENTSTHINTPSVGKVIKYLKGPAGKTFDVSPFAAERLAAAVSKLKERFGPDMTKWNYGQPSYHHVLIRHPLGNAVADDLKKRLEFGPLPRGGNGTTPGMTGSSDNQLAGASFRMAVDLADWESCRFTNTPGQSGDPDSPFFGNLFESWAADRHFQMPYARGKVEAAAVEKMILIPVKN